MASPLSSPAPGSFAPSHPSHPPGRLRSSARVVHRANHATRADGSAREERLKALTLAANLAPNEQCLLDRWLDRWGGERRSFLRVWRSAFCFGRGV